MAPEYGAMMGFFPVDEETICYMKAQELFYDGVGELEYTKVVEVNLGWLSLSQ